MPAVTGWKVEPMGDRAVLATCPDELTAQQLATAVKEKNWPGVEDVVVAYQSLAVHVKTSTLPVSQLLNELSRVKLKKLETISKLHRIPCCYEMGEDLELVARELKMNVEEVIALHSETTFTIYAIGFSPGFPYLGWLPKKLQGIARRKEPRLKVPDGSVAIVGKQSCIYPQSTPGGWALIGRTPMKLVDLQTGYFPLSVGDQVKFERIDTWNVG
ncbi:MAG TPA: allophanate hydrolase subunit 1 [Gemmatales bacterium]|nr:allophanate hydrolase subunit 1 [Gemmatales bacterium]